MLKFWIFYLSIYINLAMLVSGLINLPLLDLRHLKTKTGLLRTFGRPLPKSYQISWTIWPMKKHTSLISCVSLLTLPGMKTKKTLALMLLKFTRNCLREFKLIQSINLIIDLKFQAQLNLVLLLWPLHKSMLVYRTCYLKLSAV